MVTRHLCALAGLTIAFAAAHAQTPAQKKLIQQQNQQQKQLQNLQQQQLKARGKQANPILVNTAAQQADALKKAYVLLANADHDYDGHRAKAMHAVHAAYNELDKAIAKHGTAQQKAVAGQEDALAAAAKLAAKQTPAVHENQRASDVQLVQASEILSQLKGVYGPRKQQHVLGHVSHALDEIKIALTIR